MSCLRFGSVVGLSRVWLSLGLVVSLTAVVVGSPAPAGAVAGYGDVVEGTWYTDAVQWSVDNGIADIAGFCFAPETPVSRGETAVWIYNMENQPDTGEPHPFSDITDASQDDAISWMANNEITTGTSPTTFAPDETLRRAQVATFLHRLKGEPSAPPHSFSDVVAGWQQDSVSWMAHTGITTGTSPTTFAPEDTLTRAQLITFLYRYQGEPEVILSASTPDCDPSVDTPTRFKSVSAASTQICGIRSDDTIVCWGSRAHLLGGGFKAVSAGGDHSCAIRSDDTIVCWGDNWYGQADAPPGIFEAVSAGGVHSCAIRSDDTVVCWGSNLSGESDAPPGTFKAVSAGSNHSCGIRSDDTIVCWGRPADAPPGIFEAVSAGSNHSCGIRSDDTVVCWGSNLSGESDAPTGTFEAVSAGGDHSCAIRSDDTVVCWGDNSDGQSTVPVGGFKAVSAGGDVSCGIRSDDTAVCWGNDSRRQTTVPTRIVKAGIVNDNPNNIPGYDPDIFYTERNQVSVLIKEEIIDKYAEDNPWLLSAWNHTNRPDFEYKIDDTQFHHVQPAVIYSTHSDEELNKIRSTRFSINTPEEDSGEWGLSQSTYVHELAHVYTLANGISARPEALAAGHLYFADLSNGSAYCPGAELYADAATLLVPVGRNIYAGYWHRCEHLPSVVTSEAEAVVRSAFNDEIPRWFYDTFQQADGSWNYKAIWDLVKTLRYTERVTVVYQLKDAFGGYCSDEAARSSAFNYGLELDQPWRDGGCTTGS